MFGRIQDAASVGVWVVVVAAIAGLLVLLLQGRAFAAQPLSAADLATALAERAPLSAEEQLDAAEALLRAERSRRILELTSEVFGAGWQMFQGASPRRVAKSAVRVIRRVAKLNDRSGAEDRALDLLESAMDGGSATPRLVERYRELLEREHRERLDRSIERAESALESGHLRLARVRTERLLKIEPSSERVATLLDQLQESQPVFLEPEPISRLVVRDWEVGLAAALLAEDYERALAFEPTDADARFAHAAARYLTGERSEGLAELASLSERDDAVGSLAREWVTGSEFDAEVRLKRAERRHATRRALGLLGGEHLAAEGLELSRDGYRAWKQAIELTNVAVAAPLRFYRGWRPDDNALREAAARYLELMPDGARARDAAGWLESLGGLDPVMDPVWDDARFVLPRAHTHYAALTPRPLLVTRAVINSDALRELAPLREALGDSAAVRLLPLRELDSGIPLEPADALALLADLAQALEQKTIEPHHSSRSALLDGVRRLDLAARSGLPIVAEPWSPAPVRAREGIETALLGRESEIPGAIRMQLQNENLGVVRGFGRASFACPDDTLCVDREQLISAAVYARFDLDGDVSMGASTSFSGARVGLRLTSSGPHASIVLPLASWLGIERWVPLQAHLAVSLEGISWSPGFDTYAAAAD